MSDQGELYEKSWILYYILDRYIGSRETVAVRRKLVVVGDLLRDAPDRNVEHFTTGSRAEGLHLFGSDLDTMLIDKNVIVICPKQELSITLDSDVSVLVMRDANCRPGYVNLKRQPLGQIASSYLQQSIVAVGDAELISSEMYKRSHAKRISSMISSNIKVHGPAVNVKDEYSHGPVEFDTVISFPCNNWPLVANEWVSRPRLHNWPDKALINQIAQSGCHLVPVGYKMSSGQFLQWRISFATAERKLIHSLTHVQCLVYGLLKYFLKQISGMLEQMLDEADILSSYIIKTVIFYAVESTPESIWQEKHTFLCFKICLKILINWVNAAHCPNYFIRTNNMFFGKIHGQNQRKLLDFLTDLHDMNWECLSVGTFIQPTIGERIRSVREGELEYVLPQPTRSERQCDMEIINIAFSLTQSFDELPLSLKLLSGSTSDLDEFLGYFATVQALSNTGMKIFGEHVTARGNKEKYKSLRKCKNLLIPSSTVSTSPGLLRLATYYHQTGNYKKTLDICNHMISSPEIDLDIPSCTDIDRYEKLFCGHGYNLLRKCKAFMSDINFSKTVLPFCPSQLHQEIMTTVDKLSVDIPPLPYAVFLAFLCYHELGDNSMCDRTLIHLRDVTCDRNKGGGENWIVYNLLGICYEMVGDTLMALKEYRQSRDVRQFNQGQNTVEERIERLQHLQ
ncbi:uncharacterized protein LOC110458763 [Mizuhopecten yessoensis]|uniref:Cyclic GMP-AMP synthase n=1 Tax=Mizuhopecten yessoensis TaxID=6573 RepID=A0A210Q609_MIZYE|nr:uncharacterized protein LOC110458763 [Mizuhopecten yessoensis]OWF44158.1 Cyclic GMP-AMP synthase [Mizuhopecten yessoensis]